MSLSSKRGKRLRKVCASQSDINTQENFGEEDKEINLEKYTYLPNVSTDKSCQSSLMSLTEYFLNTFWECCIFTAQKFQ